MPVMVRIMYAIILLSATSAYMISPKQYSSRRWVVPGILLLEIAFGVILLPLMPEQLNWTMWIGFSVILLILGQVNLFYGSEFRPEPTTFYEFLQQRWRDEKQQPWKDKIIQGFWGIVGLLSLTPSGYLLLKPTTGSPNAIAFGLLISFLLMTVVLTIMSSVRGYSETLSSQ